MFADEPVERSDAELLRASAAGDTSAFEQFVSRHESWLYRYARALAGQAAEDVLQDAFVDAWRGAGTFVAGANAKPWLVTLTQNAHRRRFRLRAGEPSLHEPVESIDKLALEAGWGRSEQVVEQMAVREELSRALDRLPADERVAIVLRDLEGWSGEEAARAVGITLPAFKSRLHRARLRLAAHLQEGRHG